MDITTKVIHEVGEREFNEAVSEFYGGLPYSACLAVEGENDSSYTTEATGDELDEWDAGKLKKWLDSGMEGFSPRPEVVLAKMIREGNVPAGKYLIEICW